MRQNLPASFAYTQICFVLSLLHTFWNSFTVNPQGFSHLIETLVADWFRECFPVTSPGGVAQP